MEVVIYFKDIKRNSLLCYLKKDFLIVSSSIEKYRRNYANTIILLFSFYYLLRILVSENED